MGNTQSSTETKSSPSPPSSEACPVDESTRQAYLNAASKRTSSNRSAIPTSHSPQIHQLGTDRVTSTIPRASSAPDTTTPSPSSPPALPSPSSESHPSSPTPASAAHWIYPSERMFFDAMKRKSYSPNAPDMATVVPIHNAVNERAWSEILQWERSNWRLVAQNTPCGGPKLRSFSGDSKKLSPRARWRSLIGYEAPFDRHDWVVERCEGEGVEYVIDFYKGKGGAEGGKLNFYLDVRPKLNSWEGWRMRLGRFVRMG